MLKPRIKTSKATAITKEERAFRDLCAIEAMKILLRSFVGAEDNLAEKSITIGTLMAAERRRVDGQFQTRKRKPR